MKVFVLASFGLLAVPAQAEHSLAFYLQPAAGHLAGVHKEATGISLERQWKERFGLFVNYNYIFSFHLEDQDFKALVSARTFIQNANESGKAPIWWVTILPKKPGP